MVFASILIFSNNLIAQNIFDFVKSGNEEKVKELLKKDSQLINYKDESGKSLLHVAISNQKNNIALFLINMGMDVNLKSNTGETPLHLASISGAIEIVDLLLSKGSNIEAKDGANNTPLTNTLRFKNFDTEKILIEKGANINSKGLWEMLPIQVASIFSSQLMVDYLIEKGAEIPIAPGGDSYQLFNSACSRGLVKLFEKMLEKGFILQVNRYTSTLLHSAAAGGSEKIMEVLLSRGFKVMSGDGYGWSPLHSAAERGNLKAVELLLSKGADINDRNASGKTPYNLAVYFGNKEVSEFLALKGADKSEQQFPLLTGKYLGQKLPDTISRIFAVDIVSTKYLTHGNIVFSPNGDEAYWSGIYPTEGSLEEKFQILTMKMEDGKWTKPQLASFSKIGFDDDVPFITPDGNKLFFVSKRPLRKGEENSTKENIWFVNRVENIWTDPEPLNIVNFLELHWHISTDKNGNLYFGASDPEGKNFGEIFCSKFVKGKYKNPEKMSNKINSHNTESSPFISPEGDYLLFDRVSKKGIPSHLFIEIDH